MIFYFNSIFCATLSFWDIVNCSNYWVQILQEFFLSVLGHFFHEWCLSQKMHNVIFPGWSEFLFLGVFFCAILIFWVIVNFVFTVVNSDLDLAQRGRLCEICRWANLFRLGSSILKNAGSMGAASVGGEGGFKFMLSPQYITKGKIQNQSYPKI